MSFPPEKSIRIASWILTCIRLKLEPESKISRSSSLEVETNMPQSPAAASSRSLWDSAMLQKAPESKRNMSGFDHTSRIDPVMASTLVALTEPFLMAWCLEELISCDPSSTLSPVEDRDASQTIKSPIILASGSSGSSDLRNSWGY
jgi:hypothetical protein